MALATATAISGVGPVNALTAKGSVSWPIRAAAVLTTSYVASDHADVGGAPIALVNVVAASIDYASIEFIFEVSYDGTTFFATTWQAALTTWKDIQFAMSSFESATTQNWVIPVPMRGARFIRAKIKRTSGSATGTVALSVVAGTGA